MEIKTETSKTHDYTIYKSAYSRANVAFNLWLNHNYGGYGTFGLILKRANFSIIYNFTKEETIPLIKAMISRLTPEEKTQLGLK